MNNFIRRIAMVGLVAGAGLGFSGAAFADTVYLKDGREIEGTVTEDNNNTVSVKTAGGATKSFRRSDVDTVVYQRKGAAAAKPVEPPPVVDRRPAAPDRQDVAGKPEKKDAEKKDPKATGETQDETAAADEKDDWTAPPGLSNFPDRAKRMSKEKEKTFMDALEKVASSDEAKKTEGKAELKDLGAEGLPYFVAGVQHASVDARTACMTLVGQMNGRFAVKHVIEVFFAAMPEEGRAATYQVPFIRAAIGTLSAISGQSFISVEPKSEMVQDGLKKYIEWYNANFDRLPPQLGEKKIDATDPDYTAKLKKARTLNLARKSWPRPEMPADVAGGNEGVPPGAAERPADEAYRDTYKKVDRGDALKRPQDK